MREKSLTKSWLLYSGNTRSPLCSIFTVGMPTVNIEHNGERVLPLYKSQDFVSDFSLTFEGSQQKIDHIAEHRYLDGLLVLKNGEIIFEKYYGHLTKSRPHLMNSVSKSVVGLQANY